APPSYDETTSCTPPPPPPIEFSSRKRPREDTETEPGDIALIWAKLKEMQKQVVDVSETENKKLKQQHKELVEDMEKLKRQHKESVEDVNNLREQDVELEHSIAAL
ncbi:hypothetical protein ACHAPU_002725, partial [Fusarium lateritium]